MIGRLLLRGLSGFSLTASSFGHGLDANVSISSERKWGGKGAEAMKIVYHFKVSDSGEAKILMLS